MSLSHKCHYAIRAVYELARAGAEGPVRSPQIAERQKIPVKFLEAILNQLRQGGFVASRRGAEGGYLLVTPAKSLTLGDVIRFVEGPLSPVRCDEGDRACRSVRDTCVFAPVWKEAEEALARVYDGVTFQDLVDRSQPDSQFLDFVI